MNESASETAAIGAMPASVALERLETVDDPDVARLRSAVAGADLQNLTLDRAFESFWPGGNGKPPAWKDSNTALGFISQDDQKADEATITDARHITADESLRNSRINVRLTQFHAESYPGGNQTHRVLFAFAGKNQVPNDAEELAFNMTVDVREGQDAQIANWGVFIGLNVKESGVGFHFTTTNVLNEEDHKILDFLNSSTFTDGLKLAETAQPAIKPLTAIALGIGKMFFARGDNQTVQDVYLGLDFSRDPGGIRLAQGDYIVGQIPDGVVIDWKLWKFKNGAVRADDGFGTQFPYNHVIFSVTKYEGD